MCAIVNLSDDVSRLLNAGFALAAPPPFQEVPVERREEFMEKLESVVELANTMDDNLDRLYLLIDRSKLQHVIGAVSTTNPTPRPALLTFQLDRICTSADAHVRSAGGTRATIHHDLRRRNAVSTSA